MSHPFNNLPLIGWYPGHMLKAGRRIKENLNLVDLVIELRDARIPHAARSPEFERLFGGKPRCLVLTKSGLAGDNECAAWVEFLAGEERAAVSFVDAVTGNGLSQLPDFCRRTIERGRRASGARRGLMRPPRLIIAGIPNAGKSTLVNRLAAGKKAEVGPRPGVTRSQQWVRLRNGMELLDTPGVSWPRIRDKETELKLALAGAIKDELAGEELLAEYLLWWHMQNQGVLDFKRYDLPASEGIDVDTLLVQIGEQRGLKVRGGHVDRRRAAMVLLEDFRSGRLGRVVLDAGGL